MARFSKSDLRVIFVKLTHLSVSLHIIHYMELGCKYYMFFHDNICFQYQNKSLSSKMKHETL